MARSSERFYSAQGVRQLDAIAIGQLGVDGYELMQRAARFAWRVLLAHWPSLRRLAVLCGPGNNGGDGYELARIARRAGMAVRLVQVGRAPSGGAAARAAQAWRADGGSVCDGVDAALAEAELVVDALLGTGLSRAPDGPFAEAIAAVNRSGRPVLALDLPSGLDADSGVPYCPCVRAQVTATFVGRKLGLYTGSGPDYAGIVHADALGLPESLFDQVPALCGALEPDDLAALLPRRERAAHKNRHGHVLVVGGNRGMGGAALLAGRAALRSGAGLVSVACHARHVAALVGAQPELMVDDAAEALDRQIERCDVIAVGPGLGRDDWAQRCWRQVCASGRPMVVDADALHWLARADRPRARALVVTPHPGEVSALLGQDKQAVQRARLASAAALHRQYGAVAVLKGAGTVVHDATGADLCRHGNPGMAVGGMGDVLTGVIAALMAQGLPAAHAARAGVLAHALAGDLAAREGQRGLLPSDVIAALRAVLPS